MSTKGVSTAPSWLHLSKLIGRTPQQTASNILNFQASRLRIQNWQCKEYVICRLQGLDEEALIQQANSDSRSHVAKAAKEVLPLASEFCREHPFEWFRPMKGIRYPIARGVEVPVTPLGLIGINNRVSIVVAQTWKTVSHDAWQYRVAASLLNAAVIEQDPDIDGFYWLEMSAPSSDRDRELVVRTEETADFLTAAEVSELRRNLELAMEIVKSAPKKQRNEKPADTRQQLLPGFDSDD